MKILIMLLSRNYKKQQKTFEFSNNYWIFYTFRFYLQSTETKNLKGIDLDNVEYKVIFI